MDPAPQLPNAARALFRIGTVLISGTDAQSLLETLLARIVEELGYRAATLRILDEEHRTLELRAAHRLSQDYLGKGTVEVAQSSIDRAVLDGEIVTVLDVRSDARFQYSDAARREGLVSMIALPLALRDRVIGVLHIYTAEVHHFDDQEQALLSAIAILGAQALQRARLADALHQIAHRVTSSLSLSDVLQTLLLQSVRELHVLAGSIRLLGPDRTTLLLAAAYGLSDSYLAKGAVHISQSTVDQHVLTSLQPFAITELTAEAGFQYPDEAQREGIRSVLVAPLRAQGVAIGVLRIYSAQLRRFGAEEFAFVGTIADLGALAIENAKLHEAIKARLEALQADSNGWQRFLTLS